MLIVMRELILIPLITGPQVAPLGYTLTNTSSSCVQMSWSPPQYPNGGITGYMVRFLICFETISTKIQEYITNCIDASQFPLHAQNLLYHQ